MFIEIIYHCLEILLPCSTCTVKFVSSQWTTFTGKLFGPLILPEDCYPQRFDSLKLHRSLTAFDFDLPHSGEVLSDFTPVTPAEVSHLLQSMSSKSSPLDYIPISLLKSCTDTFSILISHLDLSFIHATFLSKFKLLSELHWLPVRHRINFKIATIKVLQFQQPSYLAALIPEYVPTWLLRSSSSLSLCVPNRKTGIAKSKSFSSVASCVWNKQVILHPFPLFPLSGRDSSTIFLSAFPGNPSPSTGITFYDVSQSTDATQARHTPPPG